jgi:molecular chaperone DnaJ
MTMVTKACPTCSGRGTVIKTPCQQCRGKGRLKTVKNLSVQIPAGVDTGDLLPIRNEGEPGTNGGPYGDLYIEFRVKKHDVFERNGINTSCSVPITYAQAALGGEIEVPTIYGKEKYTLGKGDSIFYDSIVEHHVHGKAGKAAQILAVVYIPF